MWVCISEWKSRAGKKRVSDTPVTRVMRHCDSPYLSVGNWTQSFCKTNTDFYPLSHFSSSNKYLISTYYASIIILHTGNKPLWQASFAELMWSLLYLVRNKYIIKDVQLHHLLRIKLKTDACKLSGVWLSVGYPKGFPNFLWFEQRLEVDEKANPIND